MLFSALGVERGDLVCAVGGGGKTSLLRALSRAAAQRGLTAVLTTTTHMQAPEPGVPLCSAFDPDRLRARIDARVDAMFACARCWTRTVFACSAMRRAAGSPARPARISHGCAALRM